MKLLSGSDLAEFIKERQAKQVRGLKQAHGVDPKLAIIQVKDDPVINTYVNLKRKYGDDIGVAVDVHRIAQAEVNKLLSQLNDDASVHGIIVQLPLEDSTEVETVLNQVSIKKDVDGLAEGTEFTAATPNAILWLLAGYNIEVKGKTIAIIGLGPLVGAPLAQILKDAGVNVQTADNPDEVAKATAEAEIIVSATGNPGSITSDLVPIGCVVVDAGVAVAEGKTIGDVADDVYERDDIKITPKKGGVGPLTVCALFDNVLRAALLAAKQS